MPSRSLMKERKVLKKKFKAALKVLTKCANSFTPVTLLIESAQEQCFATSTTMHCTIAGLRHVIWCLCLTFKRLFNILTFQLRFVCIFSCKIKVHRTQPGVLLKAGPRLATAKGTSGPKAWTKKLDIKLWKIRTGPWAVAGHGLWWAMGCGLLGRRPAFSKTP